MKTISYPLFTFLILMGFMTHAIAQDDRHIQQPLATIPALTILALLSLIQCSSLIAALVYFFNGQIKPMLLGLVPTVITSIVNTGILLLQYMNNHASTVAIFYFELYLVLVLVLLAAGWYRHNLAEFPKRRYSKKTAFEQLSKSEFRFKKPLI